ncbi:ABC transporter permease [Rhodoplanes sp. Z2-YC6860]|uniref:ABC transporter permease n=1 Tax=Rhodoplanes sp. Z2-YC6860 TaxID=674703 RepID=UPI00078DE14D|nr:ABC transporter permease [Rhodoplanes sp. Z2-YC6860]AMN41171.1 ABC-type spermidine/putrescine transporter, permease I [Rhodoplanes sp. Z2-YC6860]
MRRGSANAKWALLSAPMLLTLAIVFAVPIGWLIALSFFSSTGPAQVGDEVSLENYRNFITDPFYYRIIFNTFWLGGVVVLCCLIVGYPVSYFLARTKSRWRGLLLFLVVAPLLVSAVVRNIGWFPILSNTGLINTVLLKSGLISQPVPLISNLTGVVIGLVHALLPFMILTLTTVIQRIEPELEEAAANLGAGPIRAFVKVMLPLTLPGIVGGSLLVFTMAIAAYTTPVIMGGNKFLVMSTFIGQQFRTVLDYPLGATSAAVLMVLAGLLSVLAIKFGASRTEMAR